MAGLGIRDGLTEPVISPRIAASDRPGAVVVRAALALRTGNTKQATASLEAALPRLSEWGEEPFYFAAESLARAWREAGDLNRAAETLAVTRGMRDRAAFSAQYRPLLWLLAQDQLADLYRELNRPADAADLQAAIDELLAVADDDHVLRIPNAVPSSPPSDTMEGDDDASGRR